MDTKSDTFSEAKRDIEFELAERNLNLLVRYISETDPNKRKDLLDKMDDYVRIVVSEGYSTPFTYSTRLMKAMTLDKYRPKNTSLFQFALDGDLDYVGGEFNTFDVNLSRAVKNNDDPSSIRDKFDLATFNRTTLAEQFSNDWIRRLKQHPYLVEMAKKTNADLEVEAYTALFQALAKDFCDEYGFPSNILNIKVIKDWAEYTSNPADYETTTGIQRAHSWAITIPSGLSKQQKDAMLQQFTKSPETFPGAVRTSDIVVNLGIIKRHFPKDTFNHAVAVFAHEVNHALDKTASRRGALGPQVQRIDQQTYVDAKDNYREYRKSATELSSYEIEHNLLQKLRNIDY